MKHSLPVNIFKSFWMIGYLLLAICYADEIIIEGDLDVEKNAIFGGDAQFLGSVQMAPQGGLLSLDPSSVNQGNAQRYLSEDNGLLVTVRCSKLDVDVAHAANVGVLQFGSERIDTHNAFASGVFTAPYTAMYSFEGLVDLASAATIQGYKNDVLDDEEVAVLTQAGVVAINTIVSLQLGETYEFRLNAAVTQTTTSTNLSIVSLNVWEKPVSFDSVAKVRRTVYLTREMYEQAVTEGEVDAEGYATWEHPNPGTEIRFEVKAVGGGAGGISDAGNALSGPPPSNPGTDTILKNNVDEFVAEGQAAYTRININHNQYQLSAEFYGYGDGGGGAIGNSSGYFGFPAQLKFFTINGSSDVLYKVGEGGMAKGAALEYAAKDGGDGLIEIIWYE